MPGFAGYSERESETMKFIGFYDYTVILTYLSLASAVLGTIFSGRGLFTGAILCLMFSGLCDGFDGAVARSKKNRTEDEKSFGIQIDSLCDAVSFGVFPGLFAYHYGLSGAVGTVIVMAYILCAVIRLGFFNVMEIKRQKTEGGSNKYYRGMPVTTISMLLPPVYLLGQFLPEQVFVWILHGVMALSALLFVLDVRVPKLQLMKLFKR